MESFNNILARFEPISLQQMDAVKLMDRIDRKFAFSIQQLNTILNLLEPNYKVLEIADKRVSRYRSLYFDDEALGFYHQHHNGISRRVKVRHRTYVESDAAYWEVKLKNNRGRTIKSRMPLPLVPETISPELAQFVLEKSGKEVPKLQAIVWVNYQRITLVNKGSNERLTIDINLQFGKDNTEWNYPNLVIVEVKQNKKNHSPFFTCAKMLKIKQGSFSKYCLAVSLTQPGVKQNNFKIKLKQLATLLH